MPIRLGVIGFGYWGPNLMRNFATNDRFEVVALADTSAQARARARRLHPALRIADCADDLLSRTDVDAVAIATPVASHFALARAALLTRKHVLVEKPMCTTSAEAEELVALAARFDRVLMVDHTFLFAGAVQAMARTVAAGELGEVCYIDSMRANLGLFQPDVNCLWDLAPHDLSIVDQLLKSEVVAIEATGYCHVNPALPDMVYLTLHYDDHTVAHFNLSWMSPVKVRRFAIGGTRQMLIWDDLDQDQRIRIYNCGIEFQPQEQRSAIIPEYRIGDVYSPRIPRVEALEGVVAHFAHVISGEARSIMGGAEGLRMVRILEEAQRRLEVNLREVAARQKVRR